MSVLGKPIDRVDGRAKVTGTARYAVEFPVAGCAYAVIVGSAIARGRISNIDTSEATALPGVLAVMTHKNAMKLPPMGKKVGPGDRVLQLLQEDAIHFADQPVALVVADTLERSQDGARRVKIDYAAEAPVVRMKPARGDAFAHPMANGGSPDSKRGDVEAGLAAAAVRVEQTYTTPLEHHNPLEMHATTAVWEGPDRLVLYDATQGVFEARRKAAVTLGLKPDDVRVIAHFVGGGFGGKGSTWSHVVLAAMAAKQVNRPVRLMVSRPQMFAFVGHRPETVQKLQLGATRDGTLTAIRHEGLSSTSQIDEFVEPVAAATQMLYACPNVVTSHRLLRLDVSTPQFMRAPGESSGTFALESAMDELAYGLKMDPLALRLKNHADADPENGHPWSSKSLKECYQAAAQRFGWAKRNPKPGSMKQGRLLVGMGMATATYPVRRSPSSASARMGKEGRVLVQSGSQDIGPGTYTAMTQIAADALGLPIEQVRFELGDTKMPPTPVSGGSMTAASTGSAVHLASIALRDRLIKLAIADAASPLRGADVADVEADAGRLSRRSDRAKSETYAAIMARSGQNFLEERRDAKPGPEMKELGMHSFGAQFAEVHIDPDLGTLRIARWTGAFAAGRILNPKLATSQVHSGVVWGIGMALFEHTVMDEKLGRVVTRDLADYHIPVHADVPEIEVILIDEQDERVNPIGVKGIGELGITGCAAAIANAVYHATGKRIRDLPITLDKLI